jgi:hypothetical protein
MATVRSYIFYIYRLSVLTYALIIYRNINSAFAMADFSWVLEAYREQLPDGVMVAQGPLTPLVVVQIHVGQPF